MNEYFLKNDLEHNLNKFLEFCVDQELSQRTIKKYKYNITLFIDYLDAKPQKKETILSFKKFLLKQKYEISTINLYIISINKFLKFINLEEFCVKQEKKQKKYKNNKIIEYSDYHRLIRFSKKLNDEEEIYWLIRTLAETAIRIAELDFLILEKLAPSMEIFNKGKWRTIYFSNELLAGLRKLARKKKIYKGYIFHGRDRNNPISDSAVRKRLKKVAGMAKVNKKKVHPHSFRHYFSKRYLEKYPGDSSNLADILGQSSLETTRIYTQLSDKEIKEKMKTLKL